MPRGNLHIESDTTTVVDHLSDGRALVLHEVSGTITFEDGTSMRVGQAAPEEEAER